MARYIFGLLFLLILSISSFSQTNPAEQELEKVYKLLNKNKINNAEKKLVNLLVEYPDYGAAWDILHKIHYYQYEESKNSKLFGGQLTVTTTDSDGNQVASEDDSLGQSLMNLFAEMEPSKLAHNKWVYTLRKATLLSDDAYQCSIQLRNELRLVVVDTAINTKALKFYNKGEKEFQEKNYGKAAGYYQRALDIQPDFYKAQLYLADAYFYIQNYDQAIAHFKECSQRFPSFLEPRKYLIDAYMEQGQNKLAMQATIDALMCYPGLGIQTRFLDLAHRLDDQVEVLWKPRAVFPNQISSGSLNEFSTYSDPDSLISTAPWTYYQNSLPKIQPFCNSNGIITTPNALTLTPYLEVYSWEELLKNSKEDEFLQAKGIQEKGYLDCYVLITLFHADLMDQYLHFAANNPDKIKQYFQEVVLVH